MKLVELLAKELNEWPEGAKYACKDTAGTYEGSVFFVSNEPEHSDGSGGWIVCGVIDAIYNLEVSSDAKINTVTKSQWQAEREKMNKPKWIRHRGGKCPVKDGTKVVARYRDGSVSDWRMTPEEILSAIWSHSGCETDIMAYYVEETKDQEIEEVKVADVKLEMLQGDSRVTIGSVSSDFGASVFDGGQPEKSEEVKKTNFGTITYKLEIDATDANKEIDSLVEKWGQIESPLKWRDAIIHCQAIIEDCEREIERNINLLDAEGLMMQKDSKKAMQHYQTDIDMSDWRNWKRGDIISISNDPDIKDGEYKVTSIEEYDYDGDLPVQVTDGWSDFSEATVKFVQRP